MKLIMKVHPSENTLFSADCKVNIPPEGVPVTLLGAQMGKVVDAYGDGFGALEVVVELDEGVSPGVMF